MLGGLESPAQKLGLVPRAMGSYKRVFCMDDVMKLGFTEVPLGQGGGLMGNKDRNRELWINQGQWINPGRKHSKTGL